MAPSYDRAKKWLKSVKNRFRKPSQARALPPKRTSSVASSAVSRPKTANQNSSPSPVLQQDQPPSMDSAVVPSTEHLTRDPPATSSSSGPSADGDPDVSQSPVKAAVEALPRILAVASAALEVADAFGAAFPPVQPVLKVAKKALDGVKTTMKNETERKAVKEKLENGIRRLKLCESRLASSPALASRVVSLGLSTVTVLVRSTGP